MTVSSEDEYIIPWLIFSCFLHDFQRKENSFYWLLKVLRALGTVSNWKVTLPHSSLHWPMTVADLSPAAPLLLFKDTRHIPAQGLCTFNPSIWKALLLDPHMSPSLPSLRPLFKYLFLCEVHSDHLVSNDSLYPFFFICLTPNVTIWQCGGLFLKSCLLFCTLLPLECSFMRQGLCLVYCCNPRA